MENIEKFNSALDEMVAMCKWTKRREAARKASSAKEYFRNIVELDIDRKLLEIGNYLKYSRLSSSVTSEYNSIKSIYWDRAAVLFAGWEINKETYANQPESFISSVLTSMQTLYQKAQEVKPRVDAVYNSFKNEKNRASIYKSERTPNMNKDDDCLLI